MNVVCTSASPPLVCRLTDQYGTILSPSSWNAVRYTVLSRSTRCPQEIRVQLQGFLTIFEGERRFSPPLPFSTVQTICMIAPRGTSLQFQLRRFQCDLIPTFLGEDYTLEQVCVRIELDSVATSYQNAAIRSCSSSDGVPQAWFQPKRRLDVQSFYSQAQVAYDRLVCAEICQYTALSDGVKRHYTNQDAVLEYDGCGILAPDRVSYYNLFVNGVLQPKVNYAIWEGNLSFLTSDLPPKDAPIVLEFITFHAPYGQRLSVSKTSYVAISDGNKRLFLNADALPAYSDGSIPSPDSVSYFNLYSNGVLQPRTNYILSQGHLALTTSDLPLPGSLLILEAVRIYDEDQELFPAVILQYNTKASPYRCYTNCNEMWMYGQSGIPAPHTTSFQHLMVNGAMQPPINYTVQAGCLCLRTENAPIPNAPVILQSVSVLLPPVECRKQAYDETNRIFL